MKKLWKHEWKYHIAFLVLIILIFLFNDNMKWGNYEWWSLEHWEKYSNYLLDEISYLASEIIYCFMTSVIGVVLGTIIVKKCFIYWIEKDSYGREFFQVLPVTQKSRVWFHMIMDIATVVISILIYGIKEYQICIANLTSTQLEIPWLWDSIAGLIFVAISYAIMILGIVYLSESIFVNGVLKVAGFVAFMLMLYLMIEKIFSLFSKSKLVQAIYGFFTKESVAGNYYDDINWRYGYSAWVHDNCNPLVSYKGERISLQENDWTEAEFSNWNQLYDFSNVSSYIYHIIGYLAIGCILIGITIWLSGRKELSKEGFYFEFGRYLFSGLIAVTFLVMLTELKWRIWQHVINLLAAILVFFVLTYFLNSDRKAWFKKKMS